MTRLTFLMLLTALLASQAMAQSDDAAYCKKLGEYAPRFRYHRWHRQVQQGQHGSRHRHPGEEDPQQGLHATPALKAVRREPVDGRLARGEVEMQKRPFQGNCRL